MNTEDLDFNINLEVVGLAPLLLRGRCGEVNFTILEVDDPLRLTGSDYLLTSPNGYVESFFTLKSALQEAYLNWG
jgi:hypothetical protein